MEFRLSKILGANELALESVRTYVHTLVCNYNAQEGYYVGMFGASRCSALSLEMKRCSTGAEAETIIIMFADRKSALYTQQYHQLGASSRSIRYFCFTLRCEEGTFIENQNHFGFALNTMRLTYRTGLRIRKQIRKSKNI